MLHAAREFYKRGLPIRLRTESVTEVRQDTEVEEKRKRILGLTTMYHTRYIVDEGYRMNLKKLPAVFYATASGNEPLDDNSSALARFEHAVHRLVVKWLNRRSQRRSFTWEQFVRYRARHPLPRPGRLVPLNPVW